MAGWSEAGPGGPDPWKIEMGEHVVGGRPLSMAVWRFAEPLLAISSAPLGGGIGRRAWVVNAQVPHSYDRRDPDAHLTELAGSRGLGGGGVGMLTAVDVRDVERAEDGGARADVTVGVALPTWAAAPSEEREGAATAPADASSPSVEARSGREGVGTINVVAFVPERLAPAALVNAVITVTEAKSQALWEAGIAATGTASDAVCVACPPGGPAHTFGGPRSTWGARLARAVHRAVLDGCRTASA
jgi:adenosylcobinamide hydrolase